MNKRCSMAVLGLFVVALMAFATFAKLSDVQPTDDQGGAIAREVQPNDDRGGQHA